MHIDTLRIDTFGGLRLLRGGNPVTGLESRRVKALLVYLAMNQRVHQRETLTSLLWGDWVQEKAQANLREALTNLRKHLEPYVEITRDTVAIRTDANIRVDVQEFEACWGDAQKTGPLTVERSTSIANYLLLLYQGDFLQGFFIRNCQEFEEWIMGERLRLHNLLIDAVGSLVIIEIRSAYYSEALQQIERLLAIDPLVEESHRLKMLVLAMSGQRSAAIAQYNICRTKLINETSLEPAEETVRLYEKIRNNDLHLLPEVTYNEQSWSIQTSLPTPATSFIGRKRELNDVVQLLRRPETRLVTLTGPGGIGKTRLSLAVAQEIAEIFPQGIWYIELANLTQPDQLLLAIAASIGVEERAGITLLRRTKDYLNNRQSLLVLDNFEHLLAGAKLLTDLLSSVPLLKILVTSRQRLHLYGEYEYFIEPMMLPSKDDEKSVEVLSQVESAVLFAERGRAAKSDFQISNANATIIAEILRQLEGIPLAIELAAARLKMLDPDTLLKRLEDRLDLLREGPVDLHPRQQTMRATIEWSYVLLSPTEQILFRKLAVFAGSWSLEAAVSICAEREINVPAGLASLVENHLVQSLSTKEGLRFGMLATIREYALEKLTESGEAEILCEQHAVYYRECLNHPPDGVFYHLPFLEEELANYETAFSWMLARNRPEALLLGFLTSFYKYYAKSLVKQAIHVLDRAMAVAPAAPLLDQAYAYNFRGYLCVLTGEYQHWEEYVIKSLSLARQVGHNPNLLQSGLLEAGRMYLRTGNLAAAQAIAMEGKAIAKGYYTPDFLAILGEAALFLGNLSACRDYFQEGMRVSEQLTKWTWGWFQNRWYCAYLDVQLGNLDSARFHIQKIHEMPNLKEIHTYLIKELQGQIYLEEGLPDLAKPLLDEVYRYHGQAGMYVETGRILLKYAHLALLQNNALQAARIIGAAEKINAGFHIQFPALDAFLLQRLMDKAHTILPPMTVEIARSKGWAMDPHEVLEQ